MKKKLFTLTVICLLAVAILTGCTNDTTAPTKNETPSIGTTQQNTSESQASNPYLQKMPKEDNPHVTYLESFSENRAWITYSSDFGIIDTIGNLIARFDNATQCAGFDNGYTHVSQIGSMKYYTVNLNGDITSMFESDFDKERYVACGGGYLISMKNVSDFNTVGYLYTVYNPDGSINGNFTLQEDYHDLFSYLGNGVFRVIDSFYCAKSSKWIESIPYKYDDSYTMSGFRNGRKVLGALYSGDNGRNGGVLILTENGDLQVAYLDGLSSWSTISSIENDFCLIHDKGNSRIISFNVATGEYYVLDDSYYDRVTDNIRVAAPCGGRIAIPMKGADGNIYSAIFDTKFNLIADIQLGDFGGPSDGRFVSAMESAVFDLNGNFLFSIAEKGYNMYPNNSRSDLYSCGALYVGEGTFSKPTFIDINGNPLFDNISTKSTKYYIFD
ncbi:MAG: hypothetical protein ACI4EX_04835 [Lachnospiraceae bacterium]